MENMKNNLYIIYYFLNHKIVQRKSLKCPSICYMINKSSFCSFQKQGLKKKNINDLEIKGKFCLENVCLEQYMKISKNLLFKFVILTKKI